MTSRPLQWGQPERENPNGEAQSLLLTLCLRLGEFVRNNHLTSLYWVAGTNRHRIGVTLVQALSEGVDGSSPDLSGGKGCILVMPDEPAPDETLTGLGCTVLRMRERCMDSFVIVNEAAVLDVSQFDLSDSPEFCEDSTIASVYIGLFHALKRTSSRF